MLFEAKVRRPSFLFDQWRARSQIGGVVSGVEFRWNGKDYLATENPLPADVVPVLLENRYIVVTLSAGAVGEVEPKVDPPAQPAPKPAVTKLTLNKK